LSVWAIIPVKPLGRAKSRLAPVLTPEQRFAFAEALLRNTLLKVLDVPEVVGCLVVSRDNYVLSLSRDLGAYTVLESSAQELNGALLRATKVISAWNTDGVVILPADIPLINVDDLTYVIGATRQPQSVVIVPDRQRQGTNTLVVRPPGLFHYDFGLNSFDKHLALAQQVTQNVIICERPALMLDLDTPDDLQGYLNHVKQHHLQGVPLPTNLNAILGE
jgi:2-phospho-L-lactate guanylyltransferase